MTPALNWDSVARRHVEHDTAHMETFGEMGMYGKYTPVTAGNIRVTLPAGYKFTPLNDNAPLVAAATRKGDTMQTFTGRLFYPLDPDPAHIAIEDIAHALAMSCRYGGHSLRFYSVAEHSVLMARWVQRECGEFATAAIYALLHDAAEAYLCDVPRPLKRHLAGYKEAEAKVMAAICERFGLEMESNWPPIVHEADNRILADEIAQNMSPMDWHAKHDDPLGVRLEYWSPERAEREFLAEFERLAMGRAAA